MKLFKKLMSYFIALTMVLSLATLLGGNVHAEVGNTLTLSGTKNGHIYQVYQIFTGNLAEKGGNKVLSNVKWGDGVTSNSNADAADVAKRLDTNYQENDKLTIDDLIDDLTFTKAFREVPSSDKTTTTTISDLPYGYYLVKDKDGTQTNKSDAYTKFIVQVVGDTEAAIKSDVPTVIKKVKDINDSTDTTTTGWQDSADYDIGDDVPYQITGTMPDNIDAYTTYKYVFTDTMSAGLTYTAKNAKITIGDKDVTDSFTENVEAVKDQNGEKTGETKVTWTCDNLKNKEDKNLKDITLTEDSTVVVTYSAKLNEDAVIGAAGNPNKVDLTYSNNPNNSGKGETGKTPEDTNIVFTYAAKFNKVDGSNGNKPLSGAEFTLNKWNGSEFVAVKKTEKTATVENGTKFTFKGLDDGIYQLVESTTPAGYNTMKPLEFEIYATHTNDGEENPLTLTNLTMKKMENLEKTKDQTLINDVEGAKSDGIMITDVVNEKGSTLPSTGGMGTTLLYVAGGILVACAAAYVVLNKKRA